MDTFRFTTSLVLVPPFCPNASCPNHDPQEAKIHRWYTQKGYFPTHIRGKVTRFRCKTCGKYCSSQTFCTSYCSHSTLDYFDIETRTTAGCGSREICRNLKITNRVLMNSQQRIARAYLHVYDRALDGFSIPEDAAFDGFESFVASQYTPVNYHILVGSESQFPYLMNLQAMNRKGRMTTVQKANLKILHAHWSVPKGSLTHSCMSAFRDTVSLLGDRSPENPWILYTDEKTEYPAAMKRVKALANLLKTGVVIHKTVNSREPRTFVNPLFPVNYLDREFRKNMAGHVRETVRFDRELNMAAARMVIAIGNHGFRKPYRIGDRKDISTYPSHADVAGITKNPEVILALQRMYVDRHVWSHQKTKKEWMQKVWLAQYESPVHVNFKTGKKPEKGQPGNQPLAGHLVA